ncbi:MAG: Lrp/AsnC family transcriptional regulator [Oscillospiraceae bacterium]|nr:Lrp/AsnC family transcriptional regulator [Oscillospiraceae bacterium]
MYDLLKLLEDNARYSDKELSAILGISGEEVRKKIADLEEDGILRGYKAIVDWEKTERDVVMARIELKVIPKRDRGFEELAETISGFEEVQTLYLMSGGYDLAVTVVGKSFKDIANFVAHRLAPLESVQATATHFVLRKYKDKNTLFIDPERDERGVVL